MAEFHGDPNMLAIVKSIVEQAKISFVLETGTFYGDSTLAFSKMVPDVMTIEVREDFYTQAQAKFQSAGAKNITQILGKSQVRLGWALGAWLETASLDERALIFLDAHWQDDWPLHDELAMIMRTRRIYPNRLVVLIDDFEVPGRPNFASSPGGGGTPGDPMYGPRLKTDPTPCNLDTFGRYLREFRELWFPDYDGQWTGFLVASDISLQFEKLMKRHA